MATTQQPSHNYGENPWRDKDVMKELYHEKDMTQEEIADFLDCGEGTINRWVHNHDLETAKIGSTNEAIKDADLGELYWDKEMSQSEIAEKFDCSVALVSKKMDKQGVPVRGGYDGEPTIYTGTQQGYQRCYVRDCGETQKFLIHRLVAVAKFGIEAVEDMVVHHKNEVKFDNRPSNLAVMTNEEHTTHHHHSDNE